MVMLLLKLNTYRQRLTAKYNFKNSTRFTPYIGVGGTAFVAWDEKSDLGKVKVKKTLVLQVKSVLTPSQLMLKIGASSLMHVMHN